MPKTLVSDIIVNDSFTPYLKEETVARNRFARAGVIESGPEWDGYASGGGRNVIIPYWKPLEGGRQVLSDVESLTVNRIDAGRDVAWIHNDGNAWSVNGLAKYLAGTDPMKAIVADLANFWSKVDELTLISSLKGMFASATMADNRLDIHALANDAKYLTASSFVDATQMLGDHSDELGSVAMHSATEAYLRKKDMIDIVPGSEGKALIKIFQGRVVIVDDNLPIEAGAQAGDGKIFTTYLFGRGAFVRGQANLDGQPLEGGTGTEGVELSREALASDSLLINRRRYILHPRGVRCSSENFAGKSPTNEELEAAQPWTRVYAPKNIRIVAVKHCVEGILTPA